MTKVLANKTDHILYSVHESSLIHVLVLLCKQYLQISHHQLIEYTPDEMIC